MRKGHLSQYFSGVAAKRLRNVEVNQSSSNQHEFNGSRDLRVMLGDDDQRFPATYMLLKEGTEDAYVLEATANWYDTRRRIETRSAEYRLYYPAEISAVIRKANAGDLLVVAQRQDKSLLILIAPQDSTAENQVRLLFGLQEVGERFEVRTETHADEIMLGFVGNQILEAIGVEVEESNDQFLDLLLQRFKGVFPKTKDFSEFARSTLPDVSAKDGPDEAITQWMSREEVLFKTLERHILRDRLRQGFGPNGDDVDEFMRFSLSAQQRRKARVGKALENHLEALFHALSIQHSRTKRTENKSEPDFLFPGVAQYHDPAFSALNLTVLGVKSTCKDRWQQVLAEANRITNKHLFTLEPSISVNQTNKMKAFQLQLVVPTSLFPTYNAKQQSWLMNLQDFLGLVASRQRACGL